MPTTMIIWMLKGKDVEYVWIWLLTGEYWIAVSTGISIFPSFFLIIGSLNCMLSVFYYHLDLRYIVDCALDLNNRPEIYMGKYNCWWNMLPKSYRVDIAQAIVGLGFNNRSLFTLGGVKFYVAKKRRYWLQGVKAQKKGVGLYNILENCMGLSVCDRVWMNCL